MSLWLLYYVTVGAFMQYRWELVANAINANKCMVSIKSYDHAGTPT